MPYTIYIHTVSSTAIYYFFNLEHFVSNKNFCKKIINLAINLTKNVKYLFSKNYKAILKEIGHHKIEKIYYVNGLEELHS